MDNTTKMYIAYELWKAGMKIEDIAQRVERDRATIYRWVKQFQTRGIRRTVSEYKQAKKKNRIHKKITIQTKRFIYQIRREYNDCCGEKIRYYLKEDYGIDISVVTIYRILKEKYSIHNTYKKRKYGEAPKGKTPLEVIQCDTVDFGGIYAHTSIYTYTRRVSVQLVADLTALNGYRAL